MICSTVYEKLALFTLFFFFWFPKCQCVPFIISFTPHSCKHIAHRSFTALSKRLAIFFVWNIFSITRHTEASMWGQLTQGSSRARPLTDWTWGHLSPVALSPSRSEWLWLAVHSSGCSHLWAVQISKHKSRFSVTSRVGLGLTDWVYQKEHTSVSYSHLTCFHFRSNLLTSPSGPMAPIPSASPASFWRLNMTEINKHWVFDYQKEIPNRSGKLNIYKVAWYLTKSNLSLNYFMLSFSWLCCLTPFSSFSSSSSPWQLEQPCAHRQAQSGWPHIHLSVEEGRPGACPSSGQLASCNLLHPQPLGKKNRERACEEL